MSKNFLCYALRIFFILSTKQLYFLRFLKMSGMKQADPTIQNNDICVKKFRFVTANKAEFTCCLSSMFKSWCLQNNCTYIDI